MLHHERRRQASDTELDTQSRRLLVACAVLLLAVLLYPAWQLHRQLDGVQQRIDVIREQASAVGDMRAGLVNRLEVQGILVQRKNSEPGKLQLLRELTRLLPTDTWVSRLTVDGRGIVLQGESDKAFDLIELLEKTGHFEQVSFGSPVTRSNASNKERFEIHMTLEAPGNG